METFGLTLVSLLISGIALSIIMFIVDVVSAKKTGRWR